MFGNMMEKLQQAQQEMEERKTQLNHVLLDEKSPDGSIEVEISANAEIKKINFSKEIAEYDAEELEDLLILTLNKAIERANTTKEQELARVAQSSMPNIPGFN